MNIILWLMVSEMLAWMRKMDFMFYQDSCMLPPAPPPPGLYAHWWKWVKHAGIPSYTAFYACLFSSFLLLASMIIPGYHKIISGRLKKKRSHSCFLLSCHIYYKQKVGICSIFTKKKKKVGICLFHPITARISHENATLWKAAIEAKKESVNNLAYQKKILIQPTGPDSLSLLLYCQQIRTSYVFWFSYIHYYSFHHTTDTQDDSTYFAVANSASTLTVLTGQGAKAHSGFLVVSLCDTCWKYEVYNIGFTLKKPSSGFPERLDVLPFCFSIITEGCMVYSCDTTESNLSVGFLLTNCDLKLHG